MRELPSIVNGQGSTQQTSVVGDASKMWPIPKTNNLEFRIDERAYRLSRTRGTDRSQSLATWLEAARQILSESDGAVT